MTLDRQVERARRHMEEHRAKHGDPMLDGPDAGKDAKFSDEFWYLRMGLKWGTIEERETLPWWRRFIAWWRG